MVEPASPHARRNRTVAFVVLGLLIAAIPVTYVLASPAAPERHDEGFRFEQVFVGTRNGDLARPPTTLTVTAWFTNPDRHVLHDVHLVAVAVESSRNLAVASQDLSVGDLPARHTMNATWRMPLNASHEYRIEILVLVDGLLTARGDGSVGFGTYLIENDGDARVQESGLAASAPDFQYRYYPTSP